MSTPDFSAALLVGGHSRRMGRDKALLPHPAGGLFWQRQLAVLEALRPREILWSGPARPGRPETVRELLDRELDAGPLGGIVTCLEAMRTEVLLVLAVDLVQITSALLQRLLGQSTPACGAVVTLDSLYEPLAAVYPRAIQPLAAEHVAARRLALQDLLRAAEDRGLMRSIPFGANEREQFRNFNEPGDLGAAP